MDVIDFHSVLTLVFFVTFIAMVVWVYLPGRKHRYDSAAQLPLDGQREFNQEAGRHE